MVEGKCTTGFNVICGKVNMVRYGMVWECGLDYGTEWVHVKESPKTGLALGRGLSNNGQMQGMAARSQLFKEATMVAPW